jgi:hypothetical protein
MRSLDIHVRHREETSNAQSELKNYESPIYDQQAFFPRMQAKGVFKIILISSQKDQFLI